MGKRGPKPGFNVRRRISTRWSARLAYAAGLLATDGCVASKMTLIDLTSKDREQLRNFCRCVRVNFRITEKKGIGGRTYLRIQFKSVLFYNFLLSIGIFPAKSKTLGALKIPDRYFFHFLRGAFDGDGSSYTYYDPRWTSSFLFYISFNSASETHILWLRNTLSRFLGIRGHISKSRNSSVYSLRFAKREAVPLAQAMYKSGNIFLSRKRLKIRKAFAIMGEQL